MLNERQAQVLRYIIDEYVRTAEPVSSKGLCDRYALDCSSATVRNDMSALEAEGLITQPHTSAGRVPTELGYRYYIANTIASDQPRTVNINITIKAASAWKGVRLKFLFVNSMTLRIFAFFGVTDYFTCF